MPNEFFTTAEAAVLAEAAPRAVEKAIEDGIVEVHKAPGSGGARRRRLLSAESVYYISFLRETRFRFSKEIKRNIWKRFKATPASRLRTVEWSLSPGVKIKPGEVLGPTLDRVNSYAKARHRWIRADEKIKGGTPVIRGTRMSVYSVAGRVAHGESIDEIQKDNPDLDREALEAAIAYAKANPPVGRPGGRPWQA
jgi:uncharacterized protein (DUF433 family)